METYVNDSIQSEDNNPHKFNNNNNNTDSEKRVHFNLGGYVNDYLPDNITPEQVEKMFYGESVALEHIKQEPCDQSFVPRRKKRISLDDKQFVIGMQEKRDLYIKMHSNELSVSVLPEPAECIPPSSSTLQKRPREQCVPPRIMTCPNGLCKRASIVSLEHLDLEEIDTVIDLDEDVSLYWFCMYCYQKNLVMHGSTRDIEGKEILLSEYSEQNRFAYTFIRNKNKYLLEKYRRSHSGMLSAQVESLAKQLKDIKKLIPNIDEKMGTLVDLKKQRQ
jgi:hypothetical protein